MNCEEYKQSCIEKRKKQKEEALEKARPKILAISNMAKPYLSENGNVCCEICGLNFLFFYDIISPYLYSFDGYCYNIRTESDLGEFFEWQKKRNLKRTTKTQKTFLEKFLDIFIAND